MYSKYNTTKKNMSEIALRINSNKNLKIKFLNRLTGLLVHSSLLIWFLLLIFNFVLNLAWQTLCVDLQFSNFQTQRGQQQFCILFNFYSTFTYFLHLMTQKQNRWLQCTPSTQQNLVLLSKLINCSKQQPSCIISMPQLTLLPVSVCSILPQPSQHSTAHHHVSTICSFIRKFPNSSHECQNS